MEKRGRGRPAQDRQELKANVIAVATEVLLAGGFVRFNIDAVSKAGGIAKKTIYGLVGNREELVGEIVASWTSSLADYDYVGPPDGKHRDRRVALHMLLLEFTELACHAKRFHFSG